MIERFIKIPKTQSFFLFGPRGSGKSTTLSQLFRNETALWIDLLEQKLEFDLAQNPDSLLEKWAAHRKPWIVIDEVQKIPRLLDVVHRGIEKHKIKFALTGSSSRKLKRGGANLLGGRAASFQLSPFSALELGSAFDLAPALSTGLLPRFWNEHLSEKDRVRALYAYVQTYLKEEIAAEQLVRNLDPFRRFLVVAAQSNSQIINYSAIERDAGVSHSQAERHFEIVCDTLIGRYLDPFDTSIRKRQSRKSKFYFFDTGVVRALRGLAEEPLRAGTYEYGEMFETFLMNEFFKLREACEKHWNFSYLRTKDNVEIDLIIEKPRGGVILIEMKSTDNINRAEPTQSLLKLSSEFPKAVKYILSNDPNARRVHGIEYLHWQEGLKRIFDMSGNAQE